MMSGGWLVGLGLVCSLGLVVACGSDDDDTKKKITIDGGAGGLGGSGATGGSNVGGNGGSTGGSGGNTGGSGGNTGGAAGTGTGGVAGSATGGAAGSNTGGNAGANTGGAAGSATGGAAGSNTGGNAGANTGGVGGAVDAGAPNITPKLLTTSLFANCQPGSGTADPVHGEFDAKYDNAGSAAGELTITKVTLHVVTPSQTMDWTFAVVPTKSGSVPAGGTKTTTHTKTNGSGSGTGAGPCQVCNGDATLTVEWSDGSTTSSSSLNAGSFLCAV